MMAVALIGAHPAYVSALRSSSLLFWEWNPSLFLWDLTDHSFATDCRYELVQADLAVAKYSELSVINLRRLFANKGLRFMDMQKQLIEKSPPKRRLTVDTIF
jgi:hypothetical protein